MGFGEFSESSRKNRRRLSNKLSPYKIPGGIYDLANAQILRTLIKTWVPILGGPQLHSPVHKGTMPLTHHKGLNWSRLAHRDFLASRNRLVCN